MHILCHTVAKIFTVDEPICAVKQHNVSVIFMMRIKGQIKKYLF